MINIQLLEAKKLVQLENIWFETNHGIKKINEVGMDGFYLLINLLRKRTFLNEVWFNRQFISRCFGGTRTEYANRAYQALDSLINNRMLIEIENRKAYDDRVNLSLKKAEDLVGFKVGFPVFFEKDSFNLLWDDLFLIINYKGNENKAKLLSLFCAISYEFQIEKMKNIDIKYMVYVTRLTEKSVIKYKGVLEDLGLLNLP